MRCALLPAAFVLIVAVIHWVSISPEPNGELPSTVADFMGPSVDAKVPSNPETIADDSSQNQIASVLECLHAMPVNPDLLQAESIEEFAASLPDDQMVAVLRRMHPIESLTSDGIFGLCLVRRWAENSPAEAARWIAEQPENNFAREAIRMVTACWAETNLSEVAVWVQQLPATGNKTAAQLCLAFEATVQQEIATSIALIGELPDSVGRSEVLNYSLRRWASDDRSNALDWIARSEDTTGQELLDQIAVDWAVYDPASAAGFIAALPRSARPDDTVIHIVRCWSTSTPEQAAAWVERFPDSDLRDMAMENLVSVWARDDSRAAAAWVTQLPAGRSREVAIEAYAIAIDEFSRENLQSL